MDESKDWSVEGFDSCWVPAVISEFPGIQIADTTAAAGQSTFKFKAFPRDGWLSKPGWVDMASSSDDEGSRRHLTRGAPEVVSPGFAQSGKVAGVNDGKGYGDITRKQGMPTQPPFSSSSPISSSIPSSMVCSP